MVFRLTMILIVGWPFLMKGLINANNGVRAPQANEKVKKSSKMSRKSAIDSEAWSQKAPVGI
jgi:hypothetical protein